MGDFLGRITDDQDIIKKILSKVPGFSGYFERQNRRAADQLLRQSIAKEYEAQWQRISGLQKDLINNKGIQYVDDLESAAIKLRQFIDRVKTASYGYAGFFDAVKVKEDDLMKIYQYDSKLLELADEVTRAVDHVESAIVSNEGIPAVIRNLTGIAQKCVDAFNQRSDAIMGSGGATQ